MPLRIQQFENAIQKFDLKVIEQYLQQAGAEVKSDVILWAKEHVDVWSDFEKAMPCVKKLIEKGGDGPGAWSAFLKAHLARNPFRNLENELAMIKQCYTLMPGLIKEEITDALCQIQAVDRVMDFLFEAAQKVQRGLACLIHASLMTPHLKAFLDRLVRDHSADLQSVFLHTIHRKRLLDHLMSHEIDKDILDSIHDEIIKPNLGIHWDVKAIFMLACQNGCTSIIYKFLSEHASPFDVEGEDGVIFGMRIWDALMGPMIRAFLACVDQINRGYKPKSSVKELVCHVHRSVALSLLIVDGGLDLSKDGVLTSVSDVKRRTQHLAARRSLSHSLKMIVESIVGWSDGIALIADLQQKKERYQLLQNSLEEDCPTLPYIEAFKARCKKVFNDIADHLCQIVSKVHPEDQDYVNHYCRDELQRYQANTPPIDAVDDYKRRFFDYAKVQKILTMDEYQYHRLMCELMGVDEPEVVHRQHSGFQAEAGMDVRAGSKCFVVHGEKFHVLPLVDPKGASREAACDMIVLALLTSLFYHLKSSAWGNPVCVELRQWIAMIREDLPKNSDQKQYEAVHKKLEASGYYGECPSDDSDDESCAQLAARPLRERHALLVSAKQMMDYGQVGRIWTADGKKFRKPKLPKSESEMDSSANAKSKASTESLDPTGSASYDITVRAEIHHDESVPSSVHRDLSTLNHLVLSGNFNEETSKQVATRFFVAQYRGMHYETNQWSQSQRQRHRRWDERTHAFFSHAAFVKARVSVDDMMQRCDHISLIKLDESATLLRHQLTCLRFTGPVRGSYSREEEGIFGDASLALQDFYTKKYDAHKDFCGMVHNKKMQSTPIHTAKEAAFLFSQGRANYNLSTGDTPYHPLRYALGLKSYGEGKDHRLRPRWRQSRRAERPYSGKVYTLLNSVQTLHELNPAHLVSLNHRGDLSVGERILAERESTFHASLPAGSVMEVKILKYPNFDKDFDEFYHPQRYGLDRKTYNEFKRQIGDSLPHSQERKTAKFLLGEHLCAYHEACLIEDARLEARRRDGWLIYRDAYGGYGLVPPEISSASSGDRAQAGKVQRASKKARINAQAAEELGEFEAIMEKYDVVPGVNFKSVLLAMEVVSEDAFDGLSSDGIPDEEVARHLDAFKNEVQPTIKEGVVKTCLFNHLKKLVALSRMQPTHCYQLQSFLLKTPIVIGVGEEVYDFLYLGGDGFHGLQKKAVPSASHGVGVSTAGATLFSEHPQDRKRGGAPAASDRPKMSRADLSLS